MDTTQTITNDCDRIEIQASDVSGQKLANVKNVPTDSTVGELVQEPLAQMELPSNAAGQPVTYHARLDREGRHLHATETVGESLQPNDRIVLQPDIDAGSAQC